MIESFRSIFAPPRHFIILVVAAWLGLVLAEKRAEHHGVSKEQLNNLAFYSLLGFVLGGRVIFVLANFSAFIQSPLSIFSPNPDLFDPLGGLITAILVGYIYGQRQKLPLWGTLDAITPILATLAIGIPLAHLAAGTSFGRPTSLPWGIELWNATRHPTQIYDLLAFLLILALVWFRKTAPPGILFMTFISLTAGSRLFIEAFHGDSTLIFGGLRLTQVAAWIILVTVFIVSESIRRVKDSVDIN